VRIKDERVWRVERLLGSTDVDGASWRVGPSGQISSTRSLAVGSVSREIVNIVIGVQSVRELALRDSRMRV
jgi:hypothetical protein